MTVLKDVLEEYGKRSVQQVPDSRCRLRFLVEVCKDFDLMAAWICLAVFMFRSFGSFQIADLKVLEVHITYTLYAYTLLIRCLCVKNLIMGCLSILSCSLAVC